MPSRLITHPGFVVMDGPMDISDSQGSRGGGRTTSSSLSVSRSSLKISKSNLRRAVTQPRPAPQVYKTEPSDFRSLVQQLTGTSPTAESSPILTPKPLNPRLQKIAPPPLRPVFQYPSSQHQHQVALPQLQQQQVALPQQLQQQAHPQQQVLAFNPGPRRYPLTPQRPSNFAVSPLSFSPLPALSPGDQIWANVMAPPLESPGSVAMRQLTQMMDASSNSKQGLQPQPHGGLQGGMQQQNLQPGGMPHHLPQTLAHSNFSNFPLEISRFSGASPGLRFSPSTFNSTLYSSSNSSLNSTGFNPGFNPGFSTSVAMPTGYGAFGGGQFSPSSASVAMDNPFSFPEVGEVSRSAFS